MPTRAKGKAESKSKGRNRRRTSALAEEQAQHSGQQTMHANLREGMTANY